MTTALSKLPAEYAQTNDLREVMCKGLGLPKGAIQIQGCSVGRYVVNDLSFYRDRSDLASELHPIPSVAAGGYYGYRMSAKQADEPQDPVEAIYRLLRVIETSPGVRGAIDREVRARAALTPAFDTSTVKLAKVVGAMKGFGAASLNSFTAKLSGKWEGRLDEFAWLEKGWDSYNATPPTAPVIEAARGFLRVLIDFGREPSKLNPSVVGGVGFTFRRGRLSVYIEFRNTGNAHAMFMGEGKPRVVKVRQDRAGYEDILAQVETHLHEAPADARRDGA